MTTTATTEKTTVRFTVDLSLAMHEALTDLARHQRQRKAALVRLAIAQLSLQDEIGEEAPLAEETRRFTLDMEPKEHEKFSILAVRMRRSKAELARWGIFRLLQDIKDDAVVQ